MKIYFQKTRLLSSISQQSMSGYTSILSCLSGQSQSASQSDGNELSEEDTKEVNDIIEDLLTIQNKDVLKRNLTSLVTENVTLKRKCKLLEERASHSKEQFSFQIDCEGGDGEVSSDWSIV